MTPTIQTKIAPMRTLQLSLPAFSIAANDVRPIQLTVNADGRTLNVRTGCGLGTDVTRPECFALSRVLFYFMEHGLLPADEALQCFAEHGELPADEEAGEL